METNSFQIDHARATFFERYLSNENLELKKKCRTLSISLVGCFAVLLIMFIYFFYPRYIHPQFNNSPLNNTNIDVYFDGLNPSEIAIAKDLIRQINPIYTIGTRSINFTKNISKEPINPFEEGWRVLGLNRNGEIYVLFETQTKAKETLCHELMHNFLPLDDYSHEIVYDLGGKEVCYK